MPHLRYAALATLLLLALPACDRLFSYPTSLPVDQSDAALPPADGPPLPLPVDAVAPPQDGPRSPLDTAPPPVDAATPPPVDAATPPPVDAATPPVDATTPPPVDAATPKPDILSSTDLTVVPLDGGVITVDKGITDPCPGYTCKMLQDQCLASCKSGAVTIRCTSGGFCSYGEPGPPLALCGPFVGKDCELCANALASGQCHL